MVMASLVAQKRGIDWLSFEQLGDSLSLKPKKVLVFFSAEWCAYCKKMQQAAFKDPKVVSVLSSAYYAIKMDIETADTIVFGGQSFVNEEYGKTRNPVHQLPKLLASRQGPPFSVPAIIVLDPGFRVRHRYFEYLSPKQLARALEQ